MCRLPDSAGFERDAAVDNVKCDWKDRVRVNAASLDHPIPPDIDRALLVLLDHIQRAEEMRREL